MKKLKWGILSTGNIAHKFAETIKQMKGEAEIHGVASRDLQKAELFSKEYGIPRAYGSYEELALDKDVDIVYVATPHSHHFENMMLLLDHGKHILCEKSFTVNKEQAELVFQKAEEKKLFVMEGFWTKFLPIYRELEQILKRDTIGEIRMVTAQYGFCTGEERGMRKFDPCLAGGALLDIGVYAVGFAAMILGYDPVSIESLVKIGDAGTDEFSSILMQYENGSIAQLTSAIQTTIPVLGCIYGAKGYIKIEEFKNPGKYSIILNEGDGFDVEKEVEINGFEYEIREVQECVIKGNPYSKIQTPDQTIKTMEMMDRIRKIWKLEFPCENKEK